MKTRGSHRTPPRRSLLAAIGVASVAFVGEARLVEQESVAATETAFRGEGYRLTVEINPRQPIFGTLPQSNLCLQGDTRHPPAQRVSLDELRFPPDELREDEYWDCVEPSSVQTVLVIVAEPPVIRLLTGPDDELVNAVALIYRWTRLDQTAQLSTVITDLHKGVLSPVAYVAGFELLMNVTPDLPMLVDSFLTLPGRAGAATRGILDKLYVAATGLPQSEITVLARRLLAALHTEHEPTSLIGYLLWFDAHRRAWSDDPQMKVSLMAEAERASHLSFQGPHALSWQKRVREQAAFLLSVINKNA